MGGLGGRPKRRVQNRFDYRILGKLSLGPTACRNSVSNLNVAGQTRFARKPGVACKSDENCQYVQVRDGASHVGQRISAPKRPPAANPERLRAAESRQKHLVHLLAPDRGGSAASGDASPVSVPLKSVLGVRVSRDSPAGMAGVQPGPPVA